MKSFVLAFSLLCLSLSSSVFGEEKLRGYADLHNHMFAEFGYGGAWFHGHAEGPEETALKACDVDIDFFGLFEKHARTRIPFVNFLIGKTLGGPGDTGGHSGRRDGYPTYEGWPRWDTIAHQQVWEGWLKNAFDHGLRIIVISAVNFSPVCELFPKENRTTVDCDDMHAVDRQFDAVEGFVKAHPWAVIVRSSREARNAVRSGKLAILLSIEVSDLFGTEDWKTALNRYYDRGLRTLQLGHELNNRFMGPSIHHPSFRVFQFLKDLASAKKLSDFLPSRLGFQLDEKNRNRLGLTEEGKAIATEMMRRGMLIDLAHESDRAVKDFAAISARFGDYPLYVSHGHFKSMLDEGEKMAHWEKPSEDWLIELVAKTGGIFGLRTGPEKTKAYSGAAAPNDCQGSTKSFAQSYEFGSLEKKVAIAFGTDLNGFIPQIRPRFGGPDESCGAEADPEKRSVQRGNQKQPLGRRFDQTGLGRVDQLSDILDELRSFGVDTKNLEHSAENFIRTWERSERLAREAKSKNL